MRVKIVDNLMEVITDFFSGGYNHASDPEFIKLCDRISGKEVNLIFVGNDAFEEQDNNYWLPDCCWDEI